MAPKNKFLRKVTFADQPPPSPTRKCKVCDFFFCSKHKREEFFCLQCANLTCINCMTSFGACLNCDYDRRVLRFSSNLQ